MRQLKTEVKKPLLNDQDGLTEIAKESLFTRLEKNVPFKVSMFGLNGLFFSLHVVANGELVTLLESEGSSASSLILSYLSVILGASIGFVLATGLHFSPLVGKQDYKKAGNVAKTAAVLSLGFGFTSSALMLAARGIFPHFFHSHTAHIAADFLSGYAIGIAPLLLTYEAIQIAFVCGDWFIPPLSMTVIFSLSLPLSYWLGFTMHLDAFGIGLGGSIGNILVATVMAAWFSKAKYHEYQFYTLGIVDFKKTLLSMLNVGWKLAFNRLTEWLNLFLISIVVGTHSNSALGALNAAMLPQVQFAMLSQGFSQATGMLMVKNNGAKENEHISPELHPIH